MKHVWLTKLAAALLCASLITSPVYSAEPRTAAMVSGKPISMNFREQSIQEIVDILSRTERVNIILGKGVTGTISVNLYEVPLRQAVQTIAESAGYVMEERNGDYYILDKKEVGQDYAYGTTAIKSFKVQYSDPKKVSEIVGKYLSRYGKVTLLEERKMIIVEDTPDFLNRVQRLLAEVDSEPKQIMIEAKILEISLDNTESFGESVCDFLCNLRKKSNTEEKIYFVLDRGPANTALTVTITGAATTGSDVVNTVAVAAFDLVSIQHTRTGAPAAVGSARATIEIGP